MEESISQKYEQKLDEYKTGFVDGFNFKPINPEHRDSSQYNKGYEEGEVKRKKQCQKNMENEHHFLDAEFNSF